MAGVMERKKYTKNFAPFMLEIVDFIRAMLFPVENVHETKSDYGADQMLVKKFFF